MKSFKEFVFEKGNLRLINTLMSNKLSSNAWEMPYAGPMEFNETTPNSEFIKLRHFGLKCEKELNELRNEYLKMEEK